jgi:hypothetical protein
MILHKEYRSQNKNLGYIYGQALNRISLNLCAQLDETPSEMIQTVDVMSEVLLPQRHKSRLSRKAAQQSLSAALPLCPG